MSKSGFLSLEEARQYAKHLWGEEGDAWYIDAEDKPYKGEKRSFSRCAVGTSYLVERKLLFFRWKKRRYITKGASPLWMNYFEEAFRYAEAEERANEARYKHIYESADNIRGQLAMNSVLE